jgi:hypothetical protein
MQKEKIDRVGVEQVLLPTFSIAEVVGSNHPTQSIFISLVKYGIKVSSILTIVG